MDFNMTPDAAMELEALLEDSGVEYERTGGRFRFIFASGGCRWQTVCDCRDSLLLVYAIHPARVEDKNGALDMCSKLNSRIPEGCFFISGENVVCRVGVRLMEYVDARDRVRLAIEESAALMPEFWDRISLAAAKFKS